MNKPRVGMWCSYCCVLDLAEIKTQEDSDDIAEMEASDDGLTPMIFETEQEGREFFERLDGPSP